MPTVKYGRCPAIASEVVVERPGVSYVTIFEANGLIAGVVRRFFRSSCLKCRSGRTVSAPTPPPRRTGTCRTARRRRRDLGSATKPENRFRHFDGNSASLQLGDPTSATEARNLHERSSSSNSSSSTSISRWPDKLGLWTKSAATWSTPIVCWPRRWRFSPTTVNASLPPGWARSGRSHHRQREPALWPARRKGPRRGWGWRPNRGRPWDRSRREPAPLPLPVIHRRAAGPP